MDVTFCVLTYNQEELILETLESIKWQIQKYGEEHNVYLVISDDCSQDKTGQVISSWIEMNRNIFKDTKLRIADRNEGTINNLIHAINMIDTDIFKLIAGDDLFSDENIFEILSQLDVYKIITSFGVNFCHENSYGFMNDKNHFLYYSLISDTNHIKDHLKFEHVLNGPPTVFRKSLLTEDCLTFMRNFSYIEDRAMWIYFFEHNNINCMYIPKAYILHRTIATSVQHNSTFRKELLEDCLAMAEYFLQKERKVLIKLFLKWNINDIKHGSKSRWLKPSYYLLLIYRLPGTIRTLTNKNRKALDNYFKEFYIRNEAHIQMISKKAREIKNAIDKKLEVK